MRIRSRNWSLALALAAAAVVTLAMSGTFLWLKHREAPLELGCFTLFLGAFVTAGAGLTLLSLRELVAIARYGIWELEVPESGGKVGQPLPVHLFPGRRFTPTGEARLTLRCVETTVQHFYGTQGPRRAAQSRVLGAVESRVAPGPLEPRLGMVATLAPPAELPPSTPLTDHGTSIVWQLIVEVPARGGGAFVTFDLPMRPGAGSQQAADSSLAGTVLRHAGKSASGPKGSS